MKALLIEGFPTLARMCLGFPFFLIADFIEFSMTKLFNIQQLTI
jgi:hypothetical protein